MERSDEPIYVRNYSGINSDTNTPEGRTFVRAESWVAIILMIFYIIGRIVE